MALKTDTGCGTPTTTEQKDLHCRLLEIFSPIVHFESGERFFPVDLSTTVTASSLWELDHTKQPVGTNRRKAAGQIQQNDLTSATRHHYTTVAGTGLISKTIDGKFVNQPIPLLKQVLQAYTDGTIAAELTMYGTVCSARSVPGAGVVRNARPVNTDVAHAVQEGLLLNYAFYFPYRNSPEFESEGDWSGVTLLLRETPTTVADISTANKLERFLPVLSCYYRKSVEGAPPSPYFIAGHEGFRKWEDVSRSHEASVSLDTHPHVYISRGRHNCRYAPGTVTVPLSPPWSARFTPDSIEDGGYAPGPTVNTLEGGGIEDFPWWGYVLFPPFAAMVACASGCEYPFQFDSSGVSSGYQDGYQDGEDRSDVDGYEAQSTGAASPHPTKPADKATGPGAKNLSIRMLYVDLNDAGMASRWGYPGAWGSATKVQAPYAWDKLDTRVWGAYQGARRPILPAWFMWNLFLDHNFGCHGDPQLTRKPSIKDG
jgi:hypothetical protein